MIDELQRRPTHQLASMVACLQRRPTRTGLAGVEESVRQAVRVQRSEFWIKFRKFGFWALVIWVVCVVLGVEVEVGWR